MAHTDPVSNAIQAALNDINLLRVLVHTPDANAANDALTKYDSRFSLTGQDLIDFNTSLRDGRLTISAADLVDYYDRLQPQKPPKLMRVKGQEWVP